MDGNRDEGDRCFQIALGLLKKGNKKDALKFFLKSEKLYPSKRTKEHIEKLTGEVEDGEEGEENAPSANGAPGAHGTEGRFRSKRHSESEDKKCTPEEVEAVKRIRGCKDYYEMLGVGKECSEEELKKAFKRLALRFHPDKNHAPGATEAFKAISNAFSVLNDPVKRKRYDQFGVEEEDSNHHHHRHRHHHFNRGFEGDISAEDFFQTFFGGSFRDNFSEGTRVYRTYNSRTHTHHHSNQNESRSALLVQLGPIILLLCISLLNALLSQDPLYNLSRTSKYTEMKQTSNFRVNYWVKNDFKSTFKGDIQSVENQVEEDYVSNLRNNCYRERLNRENMMWQARQFQDQRMWEQARNYKMASCERLQAMSL